MPLRPAVAMPVAAALCVLALLAGVLLVTTSGSPTAEPASPVTEPEPSQTPDLRADSSVCQSILNRPGPDDPQVFSDFYTQRREVMGVSIVASRGVSAEALDIAEATIERVFQNNDLIAPLVEQRAYVIVADSSQGVLDLPEFGCLEDELGADFFSHVCGVADRADYPVATVNELDLVGDRSGPCGGLNILYHELGHLVQGWTLDPQDYFDVRLLYQAAKDSGKYINAYAATNPNEYFAEATQAYFLSQERNGERDRDWLREYDPEMFALLDRIYGG